MADLHPINQTLLTILENQISRTAHALDGVTDEVFTAPPGGDTHAIVEIGRHMVDLRRFKLMLLESPLLDGAPQSKDIATLNALTEALGAAAELVKQAITDHDPADWYRVPDEPRKGPGGDEPTLGRVSRPLNDFTSHIGSIRAIRRTMGNPAEGTQ